MTEDPPQQPAKKRVRKSRFDDETGSATQSAVSSSTVENQSTLLSVDPRIALATAAEISKNILINATLNNIETNAYEQQAKQNAIRAAEMQSQLAAQIASVTNLLKTVQHSSSSSTSSSSSSLNPSLSTAESLSIAQQIKDKNASNAANASRPRALLLDSLGREIDEQGNLVKQTTQIKTLALNNAVLAAQRKKENPYLAHRQIPNQAPAAPAHVPGVISSSLVGITSVLPPSMMTSSSSSSSATMILASGISSVYPTTTTQDAATAAAEAENNKFIDDRVVVPNRDIRAKKALHFADAGKYIQQEEEIRLKEERKIIAGYSSGRKTLGQQHDGDGDNEGGAVGGDETTTASMKLEAVEEDSIIFPPPLDGGVVPSMEWWDEMFLPKSYRENRKKSRVAAEQDDFIQLALHHVKTYKYIQHPVAIKPLGGLEKADIPLPMYLTKKERKRIRKTAREEREREKRDKMMMGLIPQAEPKFKLTNFMKVLGDQAIADPSKVEMKVLQQMRQRVMNHELRNLAAKLTPAERKEKRNRKLQEDTSRQVHVAVFRLSDFSNPKHRFKVDVNAQQHFLSGLVSLEQEGVTGTHGGGCQVVVVEGGPRGVRKMIKLMLNRINWNDVVAIDERKSAALAQQATALPLGLTSETRGDGSYSNNNNQYSSSSYSDNGGSGMDHSYGNSNSGSGGGVGKTNGDSDDESDSEDDEDGNHHTSSSSSSGSSGNECILVWQGVVPKRTFTGFKFQECRNGAASRKLFESKNVVHYYDMSLNASSGSSNSGSSSL